MSLEVHNSARWTPAVKMGLSISVATGLYGISFGALSVTAGLTALQTWVLSLLMFTGGSQFAFIGVIGGGGSGGSATAAASLLGLRNAIYAVQLNHMLHPQGWHKLLQAQLTIDESAATALSQDDPAEQRRGFWTAAVGVYVLWNLCVLLGAVLGTELGDPKSWGLDGAAVAAFMGLLWPRLDRRKPVAIAVLAAVVTIGVAPLVPPGVPILIAAGITAVVSWRLHRRRS